MNDEPEHPFAVEKTHLVVQLDECAPDESAGRSTEWPIAGKFSTRNVAGPREEERTGILALALSVLDCCTASPEEKA